MSEALLVAVGAVPGAWLRFRLVNHLAPVLPRRHWATFAVNIGASLSLGLITSLQRGCAGDARLGLLLATGFLGSLSTFSTLSLEVVQGWQAGGRRQAMALMLASLAVGLLAVFLGLGLGR